MLGTIAAIGGIASGVSSLIGGNKARKAGKAAAEQQRQMGAQNAELIAEETQEQLRRLDIQTKRTLAKGDALSAASGFLKGSSQDVYLEAITQEFAADREWAVKSSKQRQNIAKLSGQYQGDALTSQGKNAFYQGIGGMFSGLTAAASHMDWGK